MDFGSECAEHGFQIPPFQTATDLLVKDGGKGPGMYLSHDIMLSYSDVTDNPSDPGPVQT